MLNRLINIVTCILFISSFSFNFHDCNASFQCQDDGFYPHPNDCGKFYRCVHGTPYSFDCGPGTHYNPSIMTCDWPYNSGCLHSSRQTTGIDSHNAAASDQTSIQYARYEQPVQIHRNEPIVRRKPTVLRKPPISTTTALPPRYIVPVSRAQYQSNDNDQTLIPPPPSSFRRPIITNTESNIEREQSRYNRMDTTFGNRINKPTVRKSERIVLAPKNVSPNQLYYDPQTGIYHQFHYETRFPSQKAHSESNGRAIQSNETYPRQSSGHNTDQIQNFNRSIRPADSLNIVNQSHDKAISDPQSRQKSYDHSF
ncbi:hypothetical protein HUG17_8164 [Dermatophagoides farinae]|uniref:Chitin-binding type-2 domain-containing protein n=1 Tax=Dermatophagoides farinae TaxID=6954 RepID=A0A9D4NWR7_DERFA|nr:uncharacterized protein LOC124496297 isoform X1 [Dermatophagoides farinae]KAH7640695.1 hypothetical protein HUG17_8164 [Dermatophagoides farinae]